MKLTLSKRCFIRKFEIYTCYIKKSQIGMLQLCSDGVLFIIYFLFYFVSFFFINNLNIKYMKAIKLIFLNIMSNFVYSSLSSVTATDMALI